MESLIPFLQGTCTPYNMPVYPGAQRIIANSLVDGRLVPGCRSASRDLMTEKDPENNRHCGVYQDQSCRFCLNRP